MPDSLSRLLGVKSHCGTGIVLKIASFLHPQEFLSTELSVYLCMMFSSDMIRWAPCRCHTTCTSTDAESHA